MLTLLFLGSIGMTEIIVIALIVLLFFGGKKIPELMKGIGKGVKSFKDGMKNVQDELDLDKETKEINDSLNSDKK
jgi:sec-independent protein translocase protein TatA